MSGKTIYELSSPVTQTREAVAQLIAYFNHGHEPAEMPAFFRLTAEMVLVRSNKKDVYYVVTSKSCSCQTCKHQRKYFSQARDVEVVAKPMDSIRPSGKWAGGHNGPVLEMV